MKNHMRYIHWYKWFFMTRYDMMINLIVLLHQLVLYKNSLVD
jgi:hypothetical protein